MPRSGVPGRLRRTTRRAVPAMALVMLAACSSEPGPTQSPPVAVAEISTGLFTGQDSPWTTPIPTDAPIDTRSDDYKRGMLEQPLVVSQLLWTVPIYEADESTPRSDVPLTADWAPRHVLQSVPIPAGAQPDPARDAHMVVHDTSDGCVYEFWQARRDKGRWSASWGGALPTESTGIYLGGMAARASGMSAAVGLIEPGELRAGRIDHALAFAYPHTRAGGPVAPATNSDGTSTESFALPEGARIQLDPALDLDSLDLTPSERTIAEALQRYGMILADHSGGFTLYAVHPQSQPPDAFKDLFPSETWVNLKKIPADRFRVLELGPIKAESPMPEVNRCAHYG